MRGQSLEPNQYLSSPNGKYRFMMKEDGNVVIRNLHYHTDLFTLEPLDGQCFFPKCYFSFDMDGRLKQKDQFGVPRWNSNTRDRNGYKAIRLTMQNDGNLVMYDKHNRWMWQSKSHNCPSAGDPRCPVPNMGSRNIIAYGTKRGYKLEKGQSMVPGNYLQSPNKDWVFVGEPEGGNYVVYYKYGSQHQQAFFHTGENGKDTKFQFQYNGNLETTDGSNVFRPTVDWSAHTQTRASGGPKKLELDNTGNLILYSWNGPWLWGACAHGPCQNNCDQNGDGVDDGSCAGTKNF
jgi:hypothetical protein